MRGENIRNLTILLLLTFGLGQDSLQNFVDIDQPLSQKRGHCVSKEMRQNLQSNIKHNREILISNGQLNRFPNQERVLFAQPLQNSDDYNAFDNYIIYNYVNQNPEDHNDLKDWNCGDRTYHNACYDEYYCSHRGTDYTLSPFWWNMMEDNNVEVISVAEGVILNKYDSFSDDICGADYTNGLPDSLSDQWNYIVIEHGDGTIAIYGHLRKNSLTYKIEGQTVDAGEYLGIVGSSGMSYEPHLHLEIWDNTWHGNWIEGDIEASLDPFYGDCNYSNDASLWINQKPYIDPAILRIMTHSSIPEWQDCIPSILYDKDPIGPGNTFYIGVYYRDHFLGQESQYRVYDQSGIINTNMIWTDLFEGEDTHYLGPHNQVTYQDSLDRTYWIESWRKYPVTLPADTSAFGEWKIEIDFEGITYEQAFNVGYNSLISISEINILESVGDSDLVLNPGESIDITFNINNFTLFNIVELSGTIDCDSDDIIINNNIYYNSILSGTSITNSDQPFSLEFSQYIEFDEFDCNINLIYYNELDEEYSTDLLLTLPPISMNQFGFPVSTAELRSSPLVIDMDGDGDVEIIVGDNNGFVHIYNADGSEVEDDTFPYDTGNQIWGSAAAADMDGDGVMDFVITSKSKHLYIFDKYGLKTDYNANKFLMGTPAIGNLDEDPDLEVVVGGYSSPSSSNQIFAINPDGSDVDGFPLILGEKTKAGVTLADFNGNGKDDIIVGTDDDNIYVIYDDGTTASGFPYTTGDKVQAALSVLDIDGEKVIFCGSNDNSLYAINSDGSLRFNIETGDKVQSSPSFLEHNGQTYIFFGSNDDKIYAVYSNGNALSGWPVAVNGSIGGSVVFSDLDGDGNPEVVAATDMGDILAFDLDGSYVHYFPISNEFPFSGSPMITDLDNDGDLEIVAGSGSNIFVVDIKELGDTENYWNIFRGNNKRTGYYELDSNLSIVTDRPSIPDVFVLHKAYPNPFNPITQIEFGIPVQSEISLSVYNLQGRQVISLVDVNMEAGYHSVVWNADANASGVYFVKMVAGDYINTQKLMLVK